MKELNQEQHIQLLQFMSLMQNCKTEEEMQSLKTQYFNIPHYSFLQEYISDKNKEQSLASYKTSLIYDMDKYQQDYKFVYGESFPVFKKESLPNKKADYTVLNLLDEINECNNIEEYQKLLNEYNKFPKAKIENLSSDYTGIFYFSGNKVTGLPSDIIPNSPESNFNARKHLVEAGYSLFNLPSVEDVKDNGFDWLQEEISYFKKSLNPNFIEMENQINTEAAFNESEYEEYFDDFTEQMDANEGMSSIAAEADYNAFQNEQEDIDEVQRQMDIDNGLIDENGNEILYDVPESETLEQNKEDFNEVKIKDEVGFEKDIKKAQRYHTENILQLNRSIGQYKDNFLGEESQVALEKLDKYLQEIKTSASLIKADEFLKTIQSIMLADEENSKTVRHFIGEEESNLRISNHSANAVHAQFRPNETSVVIKLSSTKFKADKKSYLAEYVYESKNLSKEKQLGIINGLKDWINTGDFTDKNYDKEFYSPSKELYMQIKKQNSKPKKMIISNKVEHNINEKRIFNPEIVERNSLSESDERRLQEDFNAIGKFENAVGKWSEYSNITNFFDFHNHSDEFLKFMDAAREEKEISGHKDNISFVQHYLENKLEIPIYKNGERISPNWTDEERGRYSSVISRLNFIAQAIVKSNETYTELSSGREGVIHNTERLELYGAKDITELEKTLQKIKDELNLNNVGQEKNMTDSTEEKTEELTEELHDIDRKKVIGKELSEMIEKNVENQEISEPPSKVEDFVHNDSSEVDIPVDSKTELQTNKNITSNYSAPRPQNMKELHEFFINNPYTAGTPVPTIALRNEQTGHSTFIEGYEFARFEDIGKENPAFKDENGNQIKPDGQTVVLTKPGFREEINNETGEKELVPDEDKRKFIRISRDLYERTLKNSEIIAKRNPKTNEERQKMIDDYLEAANLDEKKQRVNTASNFWHNYQAGVMTLANNKQEAMAFAKRLVNEMIPSERKKFAAMVKNYEKIIDADGKHLSYDKRILERYEDITKGLQITNKSIWRDHVNKKYDTLETIKQNTEVFDIEGQSLDKTCRMKIGDTIKMSVTVDSALSNKKIKLPPQEYKLVAHSKDSNSVALISVDGKQKIIKSRDDFIKEVQKVEKKLIKKQQKQDRYESISM